MSEPLLHPNHPVLADELGHLRRIVADMGELVDSAITQASMDQPGSTATASTAGMRNASGTPT